MRWPRLDERYRGACGWGRAQWLLWLIVQGLQISERGLRAWAMQLSGLTQQHRLVMLGMARLCTSRQVQPVLAGGYMCSLWVCGCNLACLLCWGYKGVGGGLARRVHQASHDAGPSR